MKNLKNISKGELLSFVNSFDHVFFDVDGVLKLARATIPGSDFCVRNLRKLGKKVAIVSNNSALPKKMSVELLIDFEVKEEEVTVANEPAVNYLKKINFNKDIFLISGENTKQTLKEAGFNVVGKEPIIVESVAALKEDCLETIKEFPNVGAVVLDVDINICTAKISRAVTLLNYNKEAIFLYGPSDDSVPISKDIIILGYQYAIESIQQLTKREGICFAKPSKLLADLLNEKYNITNPRKVLFVGDNLNVDIGFGNKAGYQTLLVLSGQTHEDQIKTLEENDCSPIKPDFYAANLNAFNDMLKEIC